MKNRLHTWVKKQAERSPEAALLGGRRRESDQPVYQNAAVLPERP